MDKTIMAHITGWGALWVFVTVFFLVDTGLFFRGYNTFFWAYKTPAEIAVQCKKLGVEFDNKMRGYYDFKGGG